MEDFRELNGNYMVYSENNYKKQDNYFGTPPFMYGNDKICPKTDEKDSEILMQTDGMEVGIGPFYQVGPVPCENCPFYNYLLPYNYPYVETGEKPDPKYYWYYPYYEDKNFYDNKYNSLIPKSR